MSSKPLTRANVNAFLSRIIAVKVLTKRPKDLEDVRGLVSARGKDLNVDVIRETLRLLEGALDQSDLLPLFEQLVVFKR